MIKVCLIAAMGRNRVIGARNVMPWHIPADLKYFMARTLGKPVIMGRKTFLSIGGALQGRPNIIVTRDPTFDFEGVKRVGNLSDALREAKAMAAEMTSDEVMIVGGGSIYDQTIMQAERLYLTEIYMSPGGDTYFPDFRAVADWTEKWREHHSAKDGQPAFDFVVYERV